VLILTTASAEQAPPADLLALNRGRWTATETTHYVRDVDLKEDSSRARAPGAPRLMATLGNTIPRASGTRSTSGPQLRTRRIPRYGRSAS
jgi:hypothetical protein